MKKIIAATAVLLISGFTHAASISFAPALLSVARGGNSSEITVRVLGDYQTAVAEANVNINLDQFSFYQIESIGNNFCRLSNGKLWVMASVNAYWSAPFPTNQYTNACKLKVRPRTTASVGAYSLYFTDVYGYDASATITAMMTSSATIYVTQ